MKTIPRNEAPLTAALYLRRCEEKRNSKTSRRIDAFERIYRGALLAIAGLATLFTGVALIQISIILSK